MDDAPDATDVFAPLAAQLRQRGILTKRAGDALAVLDDEGEQVDTITAEARSDDPGWVWFYDCTDAPIARVDEPIGAALTIASNAHRGGARV